MGTRTLLASILFSVGIISLHVIGYFFPVGLLWGVHFLGFLPSSILVLYLTLSLTLLFLFSRGTGDKLLSKIADLMGRRPAIFLSVTIFVFVVGSFMFRVNVPLLGDSFVAINNYEYSFRGTHLMGIGHEPFAILYFYFIMKLLGTIAYPEIMNGFLVGEIIVGIGFIISTFLIVRNLFDDRRLQFLMFLFLLSFPYMQLFFGYAEIYSPVLFMLSLNCLLFLLSIKRKIPFVVIPPFFVLLVFIHYLTAIMAPSVFYLVYREYKEGRLKNVVNGFSLGAAVALIMLFIVGFDFTRLIPIVPHAHYISIFQAADAYQAYTFFSPYHFIDIVNLLLLMTPCPLFMILLTASCNRRALWEPTLSKLLLCSILPLMVFVIVAKFDLGLAKDWDVSSSFFFLIALYAAYIVTTVETFDVRAWNMMIAATLLHSLLFFGLNATAEPAVNRAKALLDRRIVSEGAYYQASFHLSMYYYHKKDPSSLIAVWRNFLNIFPDYTRAYEKLVKSYWELGEAGYESIAQTYEQWMSVEPNNNSTKLAYGNFLLNSGNTYYNEGKIREAIAAFEKAMIFNSTQPAIYNNLGLIFLESARYDKAIALFQKAVSLDASYAIGYKNMASAFLGKDDPQSALMWCRKAIEINPQYVGAYELAAKAYDAIGDHNNAVSFYIQAARMGSAIAQQYLMENGYSW